MARLIILTVVVLIAFSLGCKDITEYSGSIQADLLVFSSDLELVATIEGIDYGRELIVYPGYLMVVTSEGFINRYDSESLELIDTHQIGPASPSGYSKVCYSNSENSAYIIGSVGNIIEVNLPDCSIRDEFSVCQLPVEMAVTTSVTPKLLVLDGETNKLLAIRASNNVVMDQETLYSEVFCLAGSDTDTLLMGTSAGCSVISIHSGEGMRIVTPFGSTILQMERFNWFHGYVAIKQSYYGRQLGLLYMETDTLLPTPTLEFLPSEGYVSGSNYMISCDGQRYAYVLSNNGSFRGTLVQFDVGPLQITDQVGVMGYPLSIQATASGNIYVLVMKEQ